ncbi:hypothetical protein HPP92_006834 [Vanilla planifolia]|uniref:Uncharacterized protein n=1 Tax=Vanilla planifolia TaxID=51239 RepID=A0A835VBA9_VANPL|nr:hypothetical protein HPP92_006834 [Vanilla planifolia]
MYDAGENSLVALLHPRAARTAKASGHAKIRRAAAGTPGDWGAGAVGHRAAKAAAAADYCGGASGGASAVAATARHGSVHRQRWLAPPPQVSRDQGARPRSRISASARGGGQGPLWQRCSDAALYFAPAASRRWARPRASHIAAGVPSVPW